MDVESDVALEDESDVDVDVLPVDPVLWPIEGVAIKAVKAMPIIIRNMSLPPMRFGLEMIGEIGDS